MTDLPDPLQKKRKLKRRVSELEEENEHLRDHNRELAKVAHQLRGALQSIADGIGGQRTAQNALDRLASQGIDGLDVDPEEIGIKGRIEELEDENDRLRGALRVIGLGEQHEKFGTVHESHTMVQVAKHELNKDIDQ